jgi:ribonucleotide reductase alpha subunit
MMPTPVVAALFTFLVCIASCSPSIEKIDAKGSARHLLNKGQYEQAIQILEASVLAGTVDHEARLLLASAYVGSVGVNLVESFPAFEQFLFAESSRDNSKDAEDTAPPDIADRMAAERAILNMISDLVVGTRVIFGLKWIPPEKRTRLFRAAAHLDQIPKDSKHHQSALIYRTIVFSSLFMITLRSTLKEPEKIFSEPLAVFCSIDVLRFADNLRMMEMAVLLLNETAQKLAEAAQKPSKNVVKIVDAIARLNKFFESNRSALSRAYFVQGALRNELCR